MPILKLIPKNRTMTKQQWKEANRWLRITSKIMEKELNKQFSNFVLYDTTHPEHIMDKH